MMDIGKRYCDHVMKQMILNILKNFQFFPGIPLKKKEKKETTDHAELNADILKQ